MPQKQTPVRRASLADLLRIEPSGPGEFAIRLEGFEGRTFGGEILACLALAAAHTCEGKSLHGLQACFVRPVPAGVPVRLKVETISDGRRLARRRVEVREGEKLLCTAAASFAAESDGLAFQEAELDPHTPFAESLPDDRIVARAEGWEWGPGPIEWRYVGRPWPDTGAGRSSRWSAWVRPRQPLPEDPRVHVAALAYLSDVMSDWAIGRRLGGTYARERFVSLDHAIWLHRTPRWKDWWLISDRSDVAHGGRGLLHREVYTREGRLLATIAQEALVT